MESSPQGPRRVLKTRNAAWAQALARIVGSSGVRPNTISVLSVLFAAVAMGATVIEKHFTLARADGGVDATFSLEPQELASLVVETERAWQALGEVRYGPTPAEEKGRQRRRSLYIGQDLAAGELLTPANLRRIRPGLGMAPRFYEAMLGKRVTQAVKKARP